jgi:hypothetical protein
MDGYCYIYRGEASDLDSFSTTANVLEYSCLIFVVPAFSVSLILFFVFSLYLSSLIFFSFLLRNDDDGRRVRKRKILNIFVCNKGQESVLLSLKKLIFILSNTE